MSAFIVGDETINVIVGYVWAKMQLAKRNYLAKPFADLGYDLVHKSERKRLANDLFRLNCAAVEARYGEGQASEFRPLDFQYRHFFPESGPRVVKAISCLHYQCMEGDIPETSELYAALVKVCDLLCYDIVCDLPGYVNAPWG